MEWELEPGTEIVRKTLHDVYGGQRQGGISTPSGADYIMVFTDPQTGHQHGYFDEWVGGELHYCGEGQPQHGDQSMTGGNRAILEHRANGKAIHAFYGSKGTVTYAGEFALATDAEPAWYFIDAATPTGGTRKVIRFRLVPVGSLSQVEPTATRPIVTKPKPLSTGYVPAIAKPTQTSQPFEVDPDVIDRGLIGHVSTQNALEAVARSHGCLTLTPGPGDPLFDLAWRRPDGTHVVVEVKSLTALNESGQIRLGLGQVLDYAYQLRRTEPSVDAVLAVERAPSSERWVHVCAEAHVVLVWPERFRSLF